MRLIFRESLEVKLLLKLLLRQLPFVFRGSDRGMTRVIVRKKKKNTLRGGQSAEPADEAAVAPPPGGQ